MAHHAVFQLDMAHIVIVNRAIISQHFHRNAGHGARQHFIHVLTREIPLIKAHIKTLRIPCVIAPFAQYDLAGTCRISIVITQMLSPGTKRLIGVKSWGKCPLPSPIGGHIRDTQPMSQFMNGNTDQIRFSGAG